jgi:hypothetical protein
MTLYVFGDSWGAGAELDNTEQHFGIVLSNILHIKCLNYSKQGSSLGEIVSKVVSKSNLIKTNDVVVVIVPPDIRWYNVDNNMHPTTMLSMSDEWHEFAKDKTIEWFIYHHSLFIYTIVSVLKTIGCKFILAHNYGKLELRPDFEKLIDVSSNFLSIDSLTKLLSDEDWTDNYSKEMKNDGPKTEVFKGKYFEGKQWHPNGLGHKRIAELLLERLYGK